MEIHHNGMSAEITVLPFSSKEMDSAISTGIQSFIQVDGHKIPERIKSTLIAQAGIESGTEFEEPIFTIVLDDSEAYLSAYVPSEEESAYIDVILSDSELFIIRKLVA